MSWRRACRPGGRGGRPARLPAAAAALLLAACGPSDTDPGPGGVTVGEARALDEAAEMLEQQRFDPEDLAAPEEAPSPSPTG